MRAQSIQFFMDVVLLSSETVMVLVLG